MCRQSQACNSLVCKPSELMLNAAARRKWKHPQNGCWILDGKCTRIHINNIQMAFFPGKLQIIMVVFYPKFGVTNKLLIINTLRPCIVLFRGPSLRLFAAPPMRTAAPCSGRQVSLDGHVFPSQSVRGSVVHRRGGGGRGLPPPFFFFSPLAPLPPFTNPLTPDSENRWRGK